MFSLVKRCDGLKSGHTFVDVKGNDCVVRANGTIDVSLSFKGDPGMTEQSHAQGCDLNYIVGQYVRSGMDIVIPESDFRDLTELMDYQTAFNAVQKADELFSSLPAHVRAEFNHDPALLMDAVHDPSKRELLVKLGLIEAPKGQSGAPSNGQASTEASPGQGIQTPEKG